MARALLIACSILWLAGAPTWAQAPAPPAQPSITVVLKSTDEFLSDLKFIMGLGQENKAFETLKDTIEIFLVGVDTTQPVVAEVNVQQTKFKTIFRVPVPAAQLAGFIKNINTLDVKTKKQRGNNLWAVSGLFVGYMSGIGSYAIFSEEKLPAKIVASTDLANFLQAKAFDAGARIENNANGLEARRAALKPVRDELLAAAKQKKGEDPDVFALRKLTLENQLDELERFYAESAEIVAGWTTDVPKSLAMLDVHLTPLPGTGLDESAKLIGSRATYFAGYKIDEKAVLSGMINFPLDKLRGAHLTESFKLSRPIALKKIEENTTYSATKKEQAAAATSLLYDVLDQAVADGWMDGFVDVQKMANGKHSTLGALRTDGTIVLKGLQAMPESVKVALNVDKVGDVDIHSIPLVIEEADLSKVLGPGTTVYVGTSAEAVWYSLGEDALDRLKQAIPVLTERQAAATGKEPALQFHTRFEPLAKLLDATRKNDGNKAGRKIALEALKGGDDLMDCRLYRDGDQVRLQFDFHKGLLRYAGKVIGKNVNENLQ